jgi:hypothetical protein
LIRSFLLVLCLGGNSAAILAQERYSANSLMAAFDSFSNTSPKGTSIALTDVVVESKKTRIVFKSSKNGKVICELASPLSDNIASGTSLTVVGKVRGRGMLGNVTLDDCSLKTSEAVAETPPVVLPETLPVRVEVAAAPLAQPVVPPIAPPVVAKAAPAVVPVGIPAVVPRKHVPEKETRPVEMARAVDEVPDHDEGLMPKNLQLPLHPVEPQFELTDETLSSHRTTSNVFYALGGFLVGMLVLVFVKRIATSQEDDEPEKPNTPEVRRVALEELLSRRKK